MPEKPDLVEMFRSYVGALRDAQRTEAQLREEEARAKIRTVLDYVEHVNPGLKKEVDMDGKAISAEEAIRAWKRTPKGDLERNAEFWGSQKTDRFPAATVRTARESEYDKRNRAEAGKNIDWDRIIQRGAREIDR